MDRSLIMELALSRGNWFYTRTHRDRKMENIFSASLLLLSFFFFSEVKMRQIVERWFAPGGASSRCTTVLRRAIPDKIKQLGDNLLRRGN